MLAQVLDIGREQIAPLRIPNLTRTLLSRAKFANSSLKFAAPLDPQALQLSGRRDKGFEIVVNESGGLFLLVHWNYGPKYLLRTGTRS
jgi:hypothetical protein